ncbi:hypothetical protein L1987_36878 [Smallanthus sonchifolius]|uniref:Uncharacterized protein n=1 Tax=Smallanthus sonchifolius TaxID=185202 RepID=A0ACB9HEN0_9ASTR|nr:hypothetical protein L1987_36878 [Smallanthus sonchifolius]
MIQVPLRHLAYQSSSPSPAYKLEQNPITTNCFISLLPCRLPATNTIALFHSFLHRSAPPRPSFLLYFGNLRRLVLLWWFGGKKWGWVGVVSFRSRFLMVIKVDLDLFSGMGNKKKEGGDERNTVLVPESVSRMMVSISRTLITTKIPANISITPKLQLPRYNNQTPQETLNPSILLSQFQQTKILESQLVSLLGSSNNVNQSKQIHAHIIRKGLDQCCYVITKLVRVLTTKFDVSMDPYPVRMFQQVKRPNPFLYTALIRGYTMQGSLMESVRMYNLMRQQGIGPVSFTFTSLLKACSDDGGVSLGMQIHGQVIKFGGFGSDLYVSNTLIDMYVRCDLLDSARKVFDEMPERDAISWTSLIVAYTRPGNMEEAGELFDGMPVKDMVAWTTMVMGFSHNAKPREASFKFFKK